MKLDTVDILKQKILDAQENVRDYEEYSDKVDFAEESGLQARKLQGLLSKYEPLK